MPLPYVRRGDYDQLRAKLLEKDREIATLSNDLSTTCQGARGAERSTAEQIFRLTADLGAARQLHVEKQKELAELRTRIAAIEAAHRSDLSAAREEVKRLMDWITTGMTGLPVFRDLPVQPVEPAKEPESRFETASPLSEAVRSAGRRPRDVVRHMEKKLAKEFNEEVVSVIETLDMDKNEALAEAGKA